MPRPCPYPNCDQSNLSDDNRACPTCGRPVYFSGRHDFTELIVDRTRDFTGRDWVFAEIEAWLADPAGPRIYFLGGGPGSGKSAVAARLVQIARSEAPAQACPTLAQAGLAYFHFCQAQYNAVVEPVGFVTSLALALANRYPAFALALTRIGPRHPEIHVEQTVGQAAAGSIVAGVKIGTLEVGGLSARKAFVHLVAEPLHALAQSDEQGSDGQSEDEKGTIVILVDALDEALTFDPDDNIVTLLADIAADPRNLPQQVRILVTGRPDPRVVDLVGDLALDLIDDAPGSQHDVQDYAERRLTPALPEPAARRDLAERIAAAGAGNFLYARYVLDDLQKHPTDVAALALPPGLDGVYAGFLKREVGRQGRTWRTYRPLLGALVMARSAGLTRQQLAGIMHERPTAVEELLEPCMQYLTGAFPDGPFRIYHQSFRDFLVNSETYRLELDEVREDVATYLWSQYVAFQDKGAPLDGYTLANLPAHLAEAGRRDDLCSLLLDFGWTQAKLAAAGVVSLIADYDLAKDDPDVRLVRDALRLAAHAVATDKAQLPGQLVGRLASFDSARLRMFVESAKSWRGAAWLCPLTPSLDAPGGPLLRTLKGRAGGHAGTPRSVAISADGRWAISAGNSSNDRTVRVWNLETGECRRTFPNQAGGGYTPVALSATSDLAITAYEDELRAWDLSRGILRSTARCEGATVGSVALAGDGRRAMAMCWDGSVRLWDLATGAVVVLPGHHEGPGAVAMTPDGRVGVAVSMALLTAWDLESLAETGALPAPDGSSFDTRVLAISPDGRSVLLGSPLMRWIVGQDHAVDLPTEDVSEILAVTPDGRRALAKTDGSTLAVWDIPGHRQLLLLVHEGLVACAAITPDGSRAITGDYEHDLRVWDLATAGRMRLASAADQLQFVAFAAQGNAAVFQTSDETFRLLDLERAAAVASSTATDAVIQEALASVEARGATRSRVRAEVMRELSAPDERQGALGAFDSRYVPAEEMEHLLMVAAAGDGKRVLSAMRPRGKHGDYEEVEQAGPMDWNEEVKLWTFGDQLTCQALPGHSTPVTTLDITSDGRWGLTGCWGRIVRVWDLDEGVQRWVLRGHGGIVSSVAISPAGRLAVSASEDSTVRVWDLGTGQSLATFTGEGWMRMCCISPDGKIVIAQETTGRLHLLKICGADD